MQNTSVANAALFFSMNPVFAVLLESLILRERITKRELLSLGVALSGVIVVAYHDFNFSMEHLYGDVMSIICAFSLQLTF